MAGTISSTAVAQQILVGPSTTVSNYDLEAIAKDDSFNSNTLGAQSIAQQVLMVTPTLVDDYTVEIVASSGFVLPNSIGTQAVGQQVALVQPFQRLVNNFTSEIIAAESTTTPVTMYMTEIVSGLPYSTITSNVALEIVDISTITPPQPSQRAIWFIIT